MCEMIESVFCVSTALAVTKFDDEHEFFQTARESNLSMIHKREITKGIGS